MSKPEQALKWEYHRLGDINCSKWVSGNNWVTKFDEKTYCTVGINGKRDKSIWVESPSKARRWVEKIVREREERANPTHVPNMDGLPILSGTETKCRDSIGESSEKDFEIRP